MEQGRERSTMSAVVRVIGRGAVSQGDLPPRQKTGGHKGTAKRAVVVVIFIAVVGGGCILLSGHWRDSAHSEETFLQTGDVMTPSGTRPSAQVDEESRSSGGTGALGASDVTRGKQEARGAAFTDEGPSGPKNDFPMGEHHVPGRPSDPRQGQDNTDDLALQLLQQQARILHLLDQRLKEKEQEQHADDQEHRAAQPQQEEEEEEEQWPQYHQERTSQPQEQQEHPQGPGQQLQPLQPPSQQQQLQPLQPPSQQQLQPLQPPSQQQQLQRTEQHPQYQREEADQPEEDLEHTERSGQQKQPSQVPPPSRPPSQHEQHQETAGQPEQQQELTERLGQQQQQPKILPQSSSPPQQQRTEQHPQYHQDEAIQSEGPQEHPAEGQGHEKQTQAPPPSLQQQQQQRSTQHHIDKLSYEHNPKPMHPRDQLLGNAGVHEDPGEPGEPRHSAGSSYKHRRLKLPATSEAERSDLEKQAEYVENVRAGNRKRMQDWFKQLAAKKKARTVDAASLFRSYAQDKARKWGIAPKVKGTVGDNKATGQSSPVKDAAQMFKESGHRVQETVGAVRRGG